MTRAVAAALLACAASAGVLAWQVTQPMVPAAIEHDRTQAVDMPAAVPRTEEVPHAHEIEAALARPPFAPARRPPAASVPVAGASAAPVPVAIAIAADRRVVLLRVAGQERLVRARAGERINDWLVLEVLRDRVMLVDATGVLHPVPLAGPGRAPVSAPTSAPAPATPATSEPTDPNATETVRIAEEIIRATSSAP